MRRGLHTGGERLESESAANSYSEFYDMQLGGDEHLTADDLCHYGRASAKCGCDFCREQVARQNP